MRLFFALWPDTDLQAALTKLIQNLQAAHPSARWIAPEKLHMTLAFLGDVDADRLQTLERVGALPHTAAGSLVLDKLELWRRSGVLCLVPTSEPRPLLDLAARLHESLRAEGFPLERRAFKPHLTLARHASRRPGSESEMPGPFSWTPDSLTLVESCQVHGKSIYRVIASWPLPTSATDETHAISGT